MTDWHIWMMLAVLLLVAGAAVSRYTAFHPDGRFIKSLRWVAVTLFLCATISIFAAIALQ